MTKIIRKLIFYLIFLLIIIVLIFHQYRIQPFQPHQQQIYQNSTFRKVSIAYYTPLYQIRTDSHSKIFNKNLNEICRILDPEDYVHANHVLVSLVDWIDLPVLSNSSSYRSLHQSQIWIVYSEESPRNSYGKVPIKYVNELDNWFNLTATLKPESDFHIQYRGYRIKPEIGQLIERKFQIDLRPILNCSSDLFINTSSNYLNTLSSIFHRELRYRQEFLSTICPYTCNQPLSPNLLQSLQPYLKSIAPKILSREKVYIAWFVSNCNTHSRREDYVRQLRSQKNIHVDIYGSCKSIFHSPIISIACNQRSPDCMKTILSNYRFYLSFENSKCDTYITEKYWIQGLNQHSIPIVLGARKDQYQRIAVPNSFLHVDDFSSVEALAQELHRLNQNDTAYAQYLQWTQLYDISVEYNSTPGIDIHSTLCFLGHYQYLHAIKNRTEQITSLMKTIRLIFNLTNVYLPNFNWLTGQTNVIKLSEFYNPKKNCWDEDYPSLSERIFKHFFTW